MSTLAGQYIKDTYTGILHTNKDQFIDNDKKIVYDGAGNKSALSIGAENVGIKVDGEFVNNNTTYPILDPTVNQIIVSNNSDSRKLEFLDLSDLLKRIGVLINDGVYTNPTLTFVDGILTDVQGDDVNNTVNDIIGIINDINSRIPKYIVRAWGKFNGSGQSYNSQGINRVVREAVGVYRVYLETEAPNEHYLINATCFGNNPYNYSAKIRSQSSTDFVVTTGFEDGDTRYGDQDFFVSVVY